MGYINSGWLIVSAQVCEPQQGQYCISREHFSRAKIWIGLGRRLTYVAQMRCVTRFGKVVILEQKNFLVRTSFKKATNKYDSPKTIFITGKGSLFFSSLCLLNDMLLKKMVRIYPPQKSKKRLRHINGKLNFPKKIFPSITSRQNVLGYIYWSPLS